MDDTRQYLLDIVKMEHSLSFEKVFDICENRIHAIFIFLNLLELIQQKYMSIIIGEGVNNFIIEYCESPEEEPENIEEETEHS